MLHSACSRSRLGFALGVSIGSLLIAPSTLAQRAGASASSSTSLSAVADRAFAPFNSTRTPGCAVGIAQNGRTVFTRGYGMANLESGTPITPATIFESGSVAKQFTAAAVLLLVKDGKLSLDDPVRKYIPELPKYPRPILIHHLLSHTSGLREWSNLVALAGWPRGSRVHTQADLLDYVFAQRSLNYPVGDHYSYTNSGFALLPTLVERVSGMSFIEFSNARLFAPLGLVHTQWRHDFRTTVPGRAQAYARAGDTWALDMPYENVYGPGGLLTTVADWLTWNEHLTKGTLGADVVASLATRATLTSGRTIAYARGVTVNRYRGTPQVAHSGSTGGYSTYLARYPDHHLSVAVLCNAAGAPATQFAHAFVDALVPNLSAPTALDTVATDPAAAAPLAGVYVSTRTHDVVTVGTGAGFSGVTPRALRGGGWLIGTSRAIVVRAADSAVRALNIVNADGDTVTYTRASRELWRPSVGDLAEFAGTYHSDEVRATWTVRVDGDRLVASTRSAVRVTLTPVYRDGFSASNALGNVWFVRNARGTITEMHSGAARVWDFTFKRLN